MYAALLRSYLVDGWNTRTAANVGTKWLFPGGMPGQHLHIHRASDALRTAGIPVLAARNNAWLQLVREGLRGPTRSRTGTLTSSELDDKLIALEQCGLPAKAARDVLHGLPASGGGGLVRKPVSPQTPDE